MDNSRVEILEKELQELREAYRFLVLTVQYQDNPRLPFVKFCSQNFIYGDKYSDIYGYLVMLYRGGDLGSRNQDLERVHFRLRELGVPPGSEAGCLSAFLEQVER